MKIEIRILSHHFTTHHQWIVASQSQAALTKARFTFADLLCLFRNIFVTMRISLVDYHQNCRVMIGHVVVTSEDDL